MNLSPRWAEALQAAGFEAADWSSLGDPKATDEAIMEFARGEGFVFITHDLDFSAILAATRGARPSVVQIRSDDVSPEKVGNLVINALLLMSDQLDSGALITIDAARARIRVLPLIQS